MVDTPQYRSLYPSNHYKSQTDGNQLGIASPNMTDGASSNSESGLSNCHDPLLGPHELEYAVWCGLQDSGAHFSGLVVRSMPGGICLQGVLEVDDDRPMDVDLLVKRVAPVQNVLNQLVVRDSSPGCRVPR